MDNLTIIVDYNKIQSFGTVEQVLDLKPLKAKFEAFNWECLEIDGHNHKEIYDSLIDLPIKEYRPTAIIAHTIKGKGVDFMENELPWHYKSPTKEQFERAIRQIEKSL